MNGDKLSIHSLCISECSSSDDIHQLSIFLAKTIQIETAKISTGHILNQKKISRFLVNFYDVHMLQRYKSDFSTNKNIYWRTIVCTKKQSISKIIAKIMLTQSIPGDFLNSMKNSQRNIVSTIIKWIKNDNPKFNPIVLVNQSSAKYNCSKVANFTFCFLSSSKRCIQYS